MPVLLSSRWALGEVIRATWTRQREAGHRVAESQLRRSTCSEFASCMESAVGFTCNKYILQGGSLSCHQYWCHEARWAADMAFCGI